jgi:hypothetical protein
MTSDIQGATGSSRAGVASKELRGRIRRIHLEESLAVMACDLCMDEVPVEEAFKKIQDKALEKMVTLLDAGILGDSAAVKSCLEVVAKESERVAWQALEKGTAMLEEGLAILEGELELPDSGYVN